MTSTHSDPLASREDAPVPLVAIVGPTAVGKTAFSVELARTLSTRYAGAEVINADSMQFYCGMDIGTAKANLEERHGVPHHLLDVLDISEEASVATFQREARELIQTLRAKRVVPILVGGSGLYTRAALDELEFPGTDAEVRQRLEAERNELGIDVLKARLAQFDPISAERVNDDRRIIRALEVYELTGRPFSSFMPRRNYVFANTVQLGIDAGRTTLHERIQARVNGMVAAGLLEEVRALAERGLAHTKTASHAIGYRQFLSVVHGKSSIAAATESTVIATRQFAKRQQTWYRADPRVHWSAWDDPQLVPSAVEVVTGAKRAS